MVFINNYNEFLAQTRLRQGRDFDELSISSGVAVPHLKAIEKANTHPFYSRAYYERCVMKYARSLGVDEEIVLKQPEQVELALEPAAANGESASLVASTMEVDPDAPKPLPAELFASRGPLVPPDPAKPEVAETVIANPTSLNEILPPKLDMTPPKPGIAFPIFLVSVAALIVASILAWQHVQEDTGPVTVAQQTEKTEKTESVEAQAKPGDADRAASAPAPAPAPVVVDPSVKLKADVERDLALWAKYWGERNAEGHLSFFDASFPDFKKYADNRRKRIAAAQSIEVSISDVVIEKRKDDEFAARFVQSYRSDSYSSKDTKELIWKKTSSGMKIISEQVLK